MKNPVIFDFLKGFAAKPKSKEEKQRDWFKHNYPGLINNWGDYEKNKREEEKGEKY